MHAVSNVCLLGVCHVIDFVRCQALLWLGWACSRQSMDFENVFNGKYFRLVFPSLIKSLSSVLVLQFQLCLLR
jgi:hypothetical protein